MWRRGSTTIPGPQMSTIPAQGFHRGGTQLQVVALRPPPPGPARRGRAGWWCAWPEVVGRRRQAQILGEVTVFGLQVSDPKLEIQNEADGLAVDTPVEKFSDA